jgi:hypothetical protein
MGSMKDYMLDHEAERFDEWIEDNYSDVIPGSVYCDSVVQ